MSIVDEELRLGSSTDWTTHNYERLDLLIAATLTVIAAG
jgi:hypothetical protein